MCFGYFFYASPLEVLWIQKQHCGALQSKMCSVDSNAVPVRTPAVLQHHQSNPTLQTLKRSQRPASLSCVLACWAFVQNVWFLSGNSQLGQCTVSSFVLVHWGKRSWWIKEPSRPRLEFRVTCAIIDFALYFLWTEVLKKWWSLNRLIKKEK